MNDGKFTTGLLLGLILGGGAVFLLGTRTGKNLLKILSEQGMDGLVNLLQEYDLENLEEAEEEMPEEEIPSEPKIEKTPEKQEEKPSAKPRFFKRVRK